MNRKWIFVGTFLVFLACTAFAVQTKWSRPSQEVATNVVDANNVVDTNSAADDTDDLPIPTATRPLPLPTPAQRSYRDARFVLRAPQGVGSLQFSENGKVIEVFAEDWQNDSSWYPAYFDAISHKRLNYKVGSQAFTPKLRLETIYAQDGTHQVDVLGVAQGKKPLKPLLGTDSQHFGSFYANGDPNSFVCNYDSEQFSPDFSKIYITSQGELYTWSTQNGHLLRRLPLQTLKSHSLITNSVLSPDSTLIVATLDIPQGGQSITGVFDARTGKRLYVLPTEYWATFSKSGNEVQSMGAPDNNTVRYSCFDARTGRFLWRCPPGETPEHFQTTQTAVFTTSKGIIRLRDIRSGKLKRTLPGPPSEIETLAVAADASQLWTSDKKGQIWSWRIR